MMKTMKSSLVPLLLSTALFAGCSEPSRIAASEVPSTEDAASAGGRCPATTISIVSTANSNGVTQTCVASLPNSILFPYLQLLQMAEVIPLYVIAAERGHKQQQSATAPLWPTLL